MGDDSGEGLQLKEEETKSKGPPPAGLHLYCLQLGKMLLGFSTWSLNFLLFVNFDFSYFFVFF